MVFKSIYNPYTYSFTAVGPKKRIISNENFKLTANNANAYQKKYLGQDYLSNEIKRLNSNIRDPYANQNTNNKRINEDEEKLLSLLMKAIEVDGKFDKRRRNI